MGKILMKRLKSESNLFEIVSLRNCDMSSITLGEERLELAKLNLQAGMKVKMCMCSCLLVWRTVGCDLSHIPSDSVLGISECSI